MSEQVVKRYVSTRLLPDASTWNVSGAAHTYVHISDYAALEAECERLRAQVSALQSDANSWQSGHDKGREDGAKAAEGWKAQHARDSAELRRLCAERDALHAEAEALRAALLGIASVNPAERGIEWAKSYASDGLKGAGSELYARWLDTFKEAEALRSENAKLRTALAEQGERQEAVATVKENPYCPEGTSDEISEYLPVGTKLYTTPQPGPDVRGLAASLYQACGAYDMPGRILDALSAAANGEPFAHMIDGLLPCVPPSDQDARSLLSADDVRDACANAVSVFAEVTNADQCREVAEYMREVLLAQIAHRQAQRQGDSHE